MDCCAIDTKKKMQLCHAIVSGMPMYESTGIETEKGIVRVHFTHLLCDLAGQVYMGCFAIGEPFRISALRLCNIATELILSGDKYQPTKDILKKYYPKMKPHQFAGWIDEILDKHEDAREQVEFMWM